MNSQVIQACLKASWIALSPAHGALTALCQEQPAQMERASHFTVKLSPLAVLDAPRAKDLGSQAAASWN